SPRFQALNSAMISLIEEYNLVGFETLAVEDKSSMLHLTHAIDRATGYTFVPRPSNVSSTNTSSTNTSKNPQPEGTIDESHKPFSAQPNEYALF
ncbi:hypothetical protein GG344DRAFT_31855, partial [Lentinula edodes]